MLLSIAVGRALALATVTRIRASGFEMVWLSPKRVSRSAPGGEIRLACELRNRGGDDAYGVNVRAIASSMLGARIEPESIELPRGARVRLDITVSPRRVGRWGLHGIALEVRGTPLGGEGLYEVPLMFANPHGIEVLPETLQLQLANPRGGRSRRSHEAGRPSRIAGDGDALRELRDLVPGDPFKRIAWKASARRGRLLVRDMDRDEGALGRRSRRRAARWHGRVRGKHRRGASAQGRSRWTRGLRVPGPQLAHPQQRCRSRDEAGCRAYERRQHGR
jgi:uncharacterized protein (DUF58 family)